jgi:hypothetical protein
VFQLVNKQFVLELNPVLEYVEIIRHKGFYNANYSFQTIYTIFHPPATV